jgi:hypothetical protein
MEALLWRNGNRYCLAVLKNVSSSGDSPDLLGDEKRLTIQINLLVRNIRNRRTGKVFGDVQSFTDEFKAWEANLYEFALGK